LFAGIADHEVMRMKKPEKAAFGAQTPRLK
jgi:hypothetical protein